MRSWAGADRWMAGLLIVHLPLAIVFAMLQVVPALTPLVGLSPAFVALGLDRWHKARSQAIAA